MGNDTDELVGRLKKSTMQIGQSWVADPLCAEAAAAIATLERSLKFATGMHDALAAKFAVLVEENKSLRADLSACTARYNEAVLDGVRLRADAALVVKHALTIMKLRAALMMARGYVDLSDRNVMGLTPTWREVVAAIDAALSAGRGEGHDTERGPNLRMEAPPREPGG
jgi:hypothetical protein